MSCFHKNKGQTTFWGHNISTEGVFVTELYTIAGISVG